MLFKMLNVEQSSPMFSDRKIRQVFITQSRILAERVEEYYVKLVQGFVAGERGGMDTARRVLRPQAEKGLIELDDEDDIQSGLPQKFSELTDDHFPLFLTFDKVLCRASVSSYLFLNHSLALSTTGS